MTWEQIFDQWGLVEADLHEVYGIDLGDDRLMETRSWRWLENKVLGLFDRPVSGFVEMAHPSDPTKVVVKPIYPTRLQSQFFASGA